MASITNDTNKKIQMPCKFYASGSCRLGMMCKYIHDKNNLIKFDPKKTLCKFFLQGKCTNGNKCMFSHKIENISERKNNNNRNGTWSSINKLGRNVIKYPKQINNNNNNVITKTVSNLKNSQNNNIDEEDGVYFYGSDFNNGNHKNNVTKQSVTTINYGAIVEREKTELIAKGYDYNNINNNTEKVKMVETCPFYIAGYCRFGSKCNMLHSTTNNNLDGTKNITEQEKIEAKLLIQNELNESKNIECGICTSKILEESKDRFGLLLSCNHAFCLSCIRTWRENLSQKFNKEAVRLCPICRLKSDFVIPCNRLILDHTRKRELLMKYLNNLKSKKCKYYPNCPFGQSCFYAHLDSNGNLVKYEQPRFKVDHNGNMKNVSMPKLSELLESVIL